MNRVFFLCFLVVSFNSIHETDQMYRAGQGSKHVLKQLGREFFSNECQNVGTNWVKKGGTTMAPPTTEYRRPLSDPGMPFCARRYSASGISEAVAARSRSNSLVEEVEKRGICARRPDGPLKKSHTCASFFDKAPASCLPSQSLEEGGLVHHHHHHPPHHPPHPHHYHHHHHHHHNPCPSARVVVHQESIIYE